MEWYLLLGLIPIGIGIYFGFIKKKPKKKRLIINESKIVPIRKEFIPPVKDQEEFRNYTNAHRIAIGLKPFKDSPGLRNICEAHCDYMIAIGYANHHNIGLREEAAIGFGFNDMDEVVAFDFRNSKGFLHGYVNSEKGHKEIIEDPKHTHVGNFTKKDANGKKYHCSIAAIKNLIKI